MTVVSDLWQLWLGAFLGAQVLVVFFCAIKANAYRERALLLHAAATLAGVMALQSLVGRQVLLPESIFLVLLALSGLQTLELVSHAGALRATRRFLLATCVVLLPALALAAPFAGAALAAGLAAWGAIHLFVLVRAWPQSQPWIMWLAPGLLALVLAGAGLAWDRATGDLDSALPTAALLTFWTACVYLATGWRGRIFGETRARINARTTVDPLTGLATPLVLGERVEAARNLMKRYGHPSVLLLVHIENLAKIAQDFGPEAAEAAVLSTANRVRESLRDGDVAARLTHARVAVLAEGINTAEGASMIASRILVAGLKEPLAAAPAEFLRFRIVQAAIPAEDLPAKLLLHRLGVRLEHELQAPSERRIVTMSQEELLAAS